MNWAELFYYDADSPSSLRRVRDVLTKAGYPTKTRQGAVAGSLNNKGYWVVEVEGKAYLVHRIIYELFHGAPKGIVDHKDGNTANNNSWNLRDVTPKVSAQNLCKRSDNSSGFTGVTVANRKRGKFYIATWINLNGKARSKEFSVSSHGDEMALQYATDHRKKVIEHLVQSGEGYTERHGK